MPISGVSKVVEAGIEALNPYPVNLETGERELAVPGIFESIASFGRGTAEALKDPLGSLAKADQAVSDIAGRMAESTTLRPGQMGVVDGEMRPLTSEEVVSEQIASGLDPTIAVTGGAPIAARAARAGVAGLMPDPGTVSMFAPVSKLMGTEPARYKAFLDLKLRDAPDDVIFRETGIFPGDDDKLRFEIDDSKARFTGQATKNEFGTIELEDVPSVFDPEAKLGDILEHDELYKFYPEARDIPVKDTPLFSLFAEGSFDPETGLMRLKKTTGKKKDIEGALSEAEATLLHELQHYVQFKHDMNIGGNKAQFLPEGYQELQTYVRKELDDYRQALRDKGENPMSYGRLSQDLDYIDQINLREATEGLDPEIDKFTIMDRKRAQERVDVARDALGEKAFNEFVELQEANDLLSNIDRRAYNNYKRLSGEAEARMVEKRKDMTAEERAAQRPPTVTEFLEEEGVKGEPFREKSGQFSQAKADELRALEEMFEQARKIAKYEPGTVTQKFRVGGLVSIGPRGKDGIADVIRKYRREGLMD